MSAKHALGQMTATGTFGNVYYASAENQLDEMRKLIDKIDDNEFLAKLAVYSRERAYMKDMPLGIHRSGGGRQLHWVGPKTFWASRSRQRD